MDWVYKINSYLLPDESLIMFKREKNVLFLERLLAFVSFFYEKRKLGRTDYSARFLSNII